MTPRQALRKTASSRNLILWRLQHRAGEPHRDPAIHASAACRLTTCVDSGRAMDAEVIMSTAII